MAAPIFEEAWPPQSVRQALLSSPSGRKRYADFQVANTVSPTKQMAGTPSLLDRMRLARGNQDYLTLQDVEEEDDEETLQLKLAAIEAKLRLKKLQKRARREEDIASSRPTSSSTGTISGQDRAIPQVEVALSPIRKAVNVEQKSPSRVLLGIDKGVRGSDVSLRRAKTAFGSPSKIGTRGDSTGLNKPTSRTSSARSVRKDDQMPPSQIKSFSERMADVRGNDQRLLSKRETAEKMRAKGFNVDATELEKFKAAAEPQCQTKSRSPARDDIRMPGASAGSMESNHVHGLRKTKTLPDLRSAADDQIGNASLYEGYSGLHLSSRILPHSFLKRTLPTDQFTTYRIPDLLKNIKSPAFEIPDDVGNFVVFGTIASKSSPLDQKSRADDKIKTSNEWEKKWDDGTQNRRKFMALTLTDLKWTVDLFLFDTALPRYHRLSPGTIIAVLNPSIMPPKKGREDTGAFSIAIHDGDDTVLEIGTSKDLGFCNVVKKNGKECGQWVNASKSEICEWHLNAQISKTQSSRMGVNAGANGFGSNGSRNRNNGEGDSAGFGLKRPKQGRGFDWASGSQYFISSSGSNSRNTPKYNPDISTARMLDLDDDPFIAEGQFQRDKEAMLQKRMANQEKERAIARKLATLGSGSGAGADYMRRRADDDTSLKPRRNGPDHRGQTDTTADGTPQNLKSEIGRKRTAEDVRLSPVKKKTRFLTDKGIKEAGKGSMGPSAGNLRPKNDCNDVDDDDDDLDII